MARPAATDALRDSTRPRIGSRASSSQCSVTSRCMPSPSPPTTSPSRSPARPRHRGLGVRGQPDDPETGVAGLLQGANEVGHARDGQEHRRAGRNPHDRTVDLGRAALRDDDGRCPGGLGGPQDGPEIVRIGDAVEEDVEAGILQHNVEVHVSVGNLGGDALAAGAGDAVAFALAEHRNRHSDFVRSLGKALGAPARRVLEENAVNGGNRSSRCDRSAIGGSLPAACDGRGTLARGQRRCDVGTHAPVLARCGRREHVIRRRGPMSSGRAVSRGVANTARART